MVYVVPSEVRVLKAMTLLGTTYDIGDVIDGETLYYAPRLSSLLSGGWLESVPDVHQRRGDLHRPTPTNVPPVALAVLVQTPSFDFTATVSVVGMLATLTINGGDGPYTVEWGDMSGLRTVKGRTSTHTYAAGGDYTVTVTGQNADTTTVIAEAGLPLHVPTPPTLATYNLQWGMTLAVRAFTEGTGVVRDAGNTVVPGTWAWESDSTVPPVGAGTYQAVFTPDTNPEMYRPLSTPMSLTIAKRGYPVLAAVGLTGTIGAALSTVTVAPETRTYTNNVGTQTPLTFTWSWTTPSTLITSGAHNYTGVWTPNDTVHFDTINPGGTNVTGS